MIDPSLASLALIHYPVIDPVVPYLQFGKIAVRWYGVAYLLGFVAAYLVLRWMIRRQQLRITLEQLNDLVGWLALGVIAGGRMGWWLFYHTSKLGPMKNWYEPFALWQGGMSFHGGAAGVIIALLIWSHFQKAPFWNIGDCAVRVVPFGLFMGRIANFINGELYGKPSNVPWAMIFPRDPDQVPRHPSQLYEAILEGPVLFGLLWIAYRTQRRHEGRTGALFLVFYGLLRFGVEFTRQPDFQVGDNGYIAFGWLTMGQILSVAIALIGIALWIWRGQTTLSDAVSAPAQRQTPAQTKSNSAKRSRKKA